MKYNIKISAPNHACTFNFVSDLSRPFLYQLFRKVVKENYSCMVGFRAKKRIGAIFTLEEALTKAAKLRFYEHKTEHIVRQKWEWVHYRTMLFPFNVKLEKFFHSDWGGTFFEVSIAEGPHNELVSIDFEKMRDWFKEAGFDLCKSKTPGLWYTHYHIKLDAVCDELLVSKGHVTYDTIIEEKMVEI